MKAVIQPVIFSNSSFLPIPLEKLYFDDFPDDKLDFRFAFNVPNIRLARTTFLRALHKPRHVDED